MAVTDEVRVEDRGAVRWVTLNRPETRNSLTLEVNAQVIEAVKTAEQLESLRVVVLTGVGGAFCSGLDLNSVAQMGVSPAEYGPFLDSHFHGLIRAVQNCPKPVVAVVDGPAVGYGCDLALACDLRICSDRARFGEIFVKRGLMPDGGGTYLLTRLVGLGRALELMLTGDIITADEALRIGMVNRVFPVAELQAAAEMYLGKLALGAPLVHRAVKRAAYGALEGNLESALKVEREQQVKLLGSADFMEGLQAFMEKRPPAFTGS